MNSIDAIVWETEIDVPIFTFVSEWAERVLGYPRESWYEAGFWRSILHPDDVRAGDRHVPHRPAPRVGPRARIPRPRAGRALRLDARRSCASYGMTRGGRGACAASCST